MRRTAFILLIACLMGTPALAQKVQEACITPLPMRYTISGPTDMLYHWKVEGGKFATPDTLNDTIYVMWKDKGEHRLTVYGEYQGCYTNLKELMVKLNSPPFISLGPDLEKCQGEHASFEIDTSFKTIVWHDNSFGRWYTTDTTETVSVRVVNSMGCVAADTVLVSVNPLPVVNLGNDTSLCGQATLTLNAYNEGAEYRWNIQDKNGFDITEPQYTVGKGDKIYAVEVTNIHTCSATDTIHIIRCAVNFDKDNLPTALTPNGDGLNDTWVLDGLSDDYPDAIVEVYDRAGRLVFQSKRGFPEPWDGKDQKSGELLPMDNYFYIINLNKKGAGSASGSVFLIR